MNRTMVTACAVFHCLMLPFCGMSSAEQEAGSSRAVQSVAHDVEVFAEHVTRDLPLWTRNASKWPSQDAIHAKVVDDGRESVASAASETVYWVKQLLQGKWVPEDIEQRFLPLKERLH